MFKHVCVALTKVLVPTPVTVRTMWRYQRKREGMNTNEYKIERTLKSDRQEDESPDVFI